MSYAKAKYAFGFCDKTGFRYPLKDLVPEYNNGVKTGFLVGRDVVDPDQPQNFLGRVKINDPQSLTQSTPRYFFAGEPRAVWLESSLEFCAVYGSLCRESYRFYY